MTMLLFQRPNSASGVPIYLQLKRQIRHAVETGALRRGDPLPSIKALAERLVVNVNTVARVYRELDSEGVISLRHGVGAFVSEAGAVHASARITRGSELARAFLRELQAQGLSAGEIRRLVQIALDELPSAATDEAAALAGTE